MNRVLVDTISFTIDLESRLEKSDVWGIVPTALSFTLNEMLVDGECLANNIGFEGRLLLDYACFLRYSTEAGHENEGKEPDGRSYDHFYDRDPQFLPKYLCVQLPGNRKFALELLDEVFVPIWRIEDRYTTDYEDMTLKAVYQRLTDAINMLYDAVENQEALVPA